MTQAQHTHTGNSTVLPAAAAAFVMAAALAVAILLSGQVTLPTINLGASAGTQNQAAIDAGRAWQLQREQQAGMGAMSVAVLDSARQWEEQRKAQSGFGSSTERANTPTDPKIR